MHFHINRLALTVSLCASAILVGCGDDNPIAPAKGTPGIHPLLGVGVTDTIETLLAQALVIEVRDTDGELVRGVVVRFESQPSSDPARRNETAVSVCALTAPTCAAGATFRSDSTDDRGRASALIRFGSVAGKSVVRMLVPELGLVDSVVYTVTPGAPVRVRAVVADTALDIGATALLRGRVVDRYNNARTETTITSIGAGNAISLNAATGVVTANNPGLQYVYSRLGTFVDSTIVRVYPAAGRLVVWSASSNSVRLVDINGSNSRTLLTSLSSDFGVFPQFDATRQRVTLHANLSGFGSPNAAIVVDTNGAQRRNISVETGLSTVVAVRGLTDGTLSIVGRRAADAGYSLFKVSLANSLTLVAALPGFSPFDIGYGGSDISHDGTKVAYLNGSELRVLNVVTGAITVLAANGRSPRWSALDDRVAYLAPIGTFDGTIVVINADGTNARAVGSTVFSPGLTWSPDGKFIVGRSSISPAATLMLVQVSDGASVPLRFANAGGVEDYYQPDWR
ncbi:MAG: hypothetical protein ABI852_16455 [Gemmatimonadaceae bacterium]